jgi:hypothetical protein
MLDQDSWFTPSLSIAYSVTPPCLKSRNNSRSSQSRRPLVRQDAICPSGHDPDIAPSRRRLTCPAMVRLPFRRLGGQFFRLSPFSAGFWGASRQTGPGVQRSELPGGGPERLGGLMARCPFRLAGFRRAWSRIPLRGPSIVPHPALGRRCCGPRVHALQSTDAELGWLPSARVHSS